MLICHYCFTHTLDEEDKCTLQKNRANVLLLEIYVYSHMNNTVLSDNCLHTLQQSKMTTRTRLLTAGKWFVNYWMFSILFRTRLLSFAIHKQNLCHVCNKSYDVNDVQSKHRGEYSMWESFTTFEWSTCEVLEWLPACILIQGI